MRFSFIFLASSYLLVGLGYVGLLFTGELSYPYLLLAGFSIILALLGEARGGTGFLPAPLANIIMMGVFVLTIVTIFIFKSPPVQEVIHFLLALQAVKLAAPKKRRDWLQLYLLSFFSVVSAAALSVEVSFAFVFVLYLFTAPWVLVVFHLKDSMERAGKDPEAQSNLVGWPLFRLVVKISGCLFVFMMIFFIALPRFGTGLWGNSWSNGYGMTGFTDRLSLGDVAEIKKITAVAMRVSISGIDLSKKKPRYWRGISLDRFDGKKWDRSVTNLTRVARAGGSYMVGKWEDNQAPLLRQEIILEPTSSQALFALGRPVMISGNLRQLYQDPFGNLRSSYPFPFQVSYSVLSYEDGKINGTPVGGNFLQLPDIDPRIADLSRQITVGISGPIRKAQALDNYLKKNYGYSLTNLAMGETDPLARFLFDVRAGDCEYFSSALTVMLRNIGIPARVVNGYIGGEWNPYGEYYVIRQSNAHSWVEVYIRNRGWVTFDPTPSYIGNSQRTLFANMSHFLDFLRMRWYRYVVNFGFSDQYRIFSTLRQTSTWFDSGRRKASMDQLRRWLTVKKGWKKLGGFFLISLVLAWWIWWIRKKFTLTFTTRHLSHEASERYRHLLNLLRRKGFRKKPGDTPDEFRRSVEYKERGLITEFTSLYQEARFSGLKDFTAGLQRMDEIFLQLRKRKKLA